MENKITILAPAKINIFLDVKGKRSDGYHEISSVMQTVGIFDRINIEKREPSEGGGAIFVSCDNGVPSGRENVVYDAAREFFAEAGIENYNVGIEVSKRIPMCAGLGGGSSDAAATVLALNSLYESPLSSEDMMRVCVRVGSDVPFCLKKGTCHVGGVGDVVESCTPMPDCVIVVAVPKQMQISTSEAYADIDKIKSSKPIDGIFEALAECSLDMLGKAMFNKFEYVLPADATVFKIKKALADAGSPAVMMSGSGSAVFALFSDVSPAKSAAEALDAVAETFVCRPVRRSYRFIEES